MTLTDNREVDRYVDQELRTFRVAGATHIYKGALVGLDADGYAQPLTAGDAFVGLAYEEADNSSGSDGGISVRVFTLGDFELALSGAAVGDIGRPVFASADDTLTFTAVDNSCVGIVQDVPSSGKIILRIGPPAGAVKTVKHDVEDLSAGSDISSRAVHAFAQAGWIVAARVVNHETAAAGIDAGNTCVVGVALNSTSVASKTYNDSVSFPDANAADSLGAISSPAISAGDVLKIAVANGAAADPGPFTIEVDYV